jgi:hypothetical protein
MRRLVALLLICLMPLPVLAQAQPSPKPVRVRITGQETYQVPGVIEIQEDRISGRPAATTDRFVQFNRSADGRLLSVPRPRQGVAGHATAISDGLLAFIPDRESERLYVPLDAVAKIEIARVPASRAAWTNVGVFAGIGAFFLIFTTFLTVCGDEGGCGGGFAGYSLSIGGGIAAGTAIRSIGRTRWRVVSLDELGGLFAPSPNPI